MNSKNRFAFVKLVAAILGVDVNFGPPRTLPKNVVFVRHGQSIGNLAVLMSKDGDHSLFEDWQKTGRHSKTWELTDLGIEQAKKAGQWMRENNLDKFDHYYVSAYYRAVQTAAYLNLPGALWHKPKVMMRERDRGLMDIASIKSLEDEFAYVRAGEAQEAFLTRYPHGESLADQQLRNRSMTSTWEREAPNEDVVAVCHGEVIDVFNVDWMGLSLEDFAQQKRSNSPYDKVHNCQIVHYTREIEGSNELTVFFNRVRSICPWNTELSTNEWRPIERKRFTNEELLASIPVHA